MKKISKIIMALGLVTSLVLAGCGNSNAGGTAQTPAQPPAPVETKEILVSAAASLNKSMEEVQKKFNEKNPNIKLTFSFGSSGTLQQQIEQGAPADIFIPAGQKQIDTLNGKNLLVKESIVNLLLNDLVLVAGKDNQDITKVEDLTKDSIKQIGIGTPETVPAGQYGKEALTTLGLWDKLNSKYVQAKDVTAVLNYVETGNTEAGIVYKSDAQGSDKVKVVATFPADSHKPIVYPGAIIAATKNKEAAQTFLDYLKSAEAQQIFNNYGFSSPK